MGLSQRYQPLLCAWFVAYSSEFDSYGLNLVIVLLRVVAAIWAGRRDHSAASGAVAAVDTALLAGLLFFVDFVFTTYATGSGTPSGVIFQEFIRSVARDFRTWSVGDNLGGACFMLCFIPVIGLALAIPLSRLATPTTQRSMG